jgi:hypothetical protein
VRRADGLGALCVAAGTRRKVPDGRSSVSIDKRNRRRTFGVEIDAFIFPWRSPWRSIPTMAGRRHCSDRTT